MCNARNHSSGCTCGFGGDGHLGGGGNRNSSTRVIIRLASSYTITKTLTWQQNISEDFCKPSKCPRCGASVYFVRHNGGNVWLDSLGAPWPKHACFDDDIPSIIRHQLVEEKRTVFGVVMTVALIESSEDSIITVKCHNNKTITVKIGSQGDITKWLGRLVSVKEFGLLIGLSDYFGNQIEGIRHT